MIRGDGACGKTSLLNVFTRGYVFRDGKNTMSCGLISHAATSQPFTSQLSSRTTSTVCDPTVTPGNAANGLGQISSWIMCISSYPYGTPLAKKNSIGYDPFPTVIDAEPLTGAIVLTSPR